MALFDLESTCTMQELGGLYAFESQLQDDIKDSDAKCLIANSASHDSDEKLMNLGFDLVYEYMGGHGKMIYVWMKNLNK